MKHILNLEESNSELNEIFLKINESNTILFLGAGASIGEKKYLSKHIIEFYESKIGKNLNEPDITKWIDVLSENDDFSRTDFDNFVVDIIKKLEVTESHKIIASLPWREIITTNFDLLIEEAFDEVNKFSDKNLDLFTVRRLNDFFHKTANSELKYIKLNGCIKDKSIYPLAFSSADFSNLKKFYKAVLNDLKSLSPRIQFLTIGYSFADTFGRNLLERFDSYDYRDKKWILNVDPHPNEEMYSYLLSKKVRVIKCTMEEFFSKYKEWERTSAEAIIKKNKLSVLNSNNNHIKINYRLLLNLQGVVNQLNRNRNENFIKKIDFYRGEEPNYQIVIRNVDVIKSKQIIESTEKIINVSKNSTSSFIPIFYISGEFGIGKSTFTYRLIHELEKLTNFDLVSFEIIDLIRVRKVDIYDLVKSCNSKNFILLCDEIEIESNFKKMVDLQRDLSIEQINDCNLFILAPIRENILEKHRLERSTPNSHVLNINGKYDVEEINDLLNKLKEQNLISFRDINEKNKLIKKIKEDYNSDSFLSLMSTITSGSHEKYLFSCYEQLSNETKSAFIYIALLHRYKISFPASWLKKIVKMDWEEFTTKVINAEGKGILVQTTPTSNGTIPDLYFSTKHPLIAQKLIEMILPNIDKQFSKYIAILKNVEYGIVNSYTSISLLKVLSKSGDFSKTQVNKFYDTAYLNLLDDPFFLLHYTINLQSRNTKENLEKGIRLLLYAETLFENRNHRFIHRRAVLNFSLAKLFYKLETEVSKSKYYLIESEELFKVKLLLDPFSSFSYYDYINYLIWKLENIILEDDDILKIQILIGELFDIANKTVTDNLAKIQLLITSYAKYIETITKGFDYENYLLGMYEQIDLRPFACILLFSFYEEKNNSSKCRYYLKELESMTDNFEVVKFLFKIYGRKIYDANVRVNLFNLIRNNSQLEEDNPLRYSYISFVLESYNLNFSLGRDFLSNIKNKYHKLNPEFKNIWSNSEGTPIIFKGMIVSSRNGRYKNIKIIEFQQTTRLIKGDYNQYSIGTMVSVKLHFFLYGIIAEIIEDN